MSKFLKILKGKLTLGNLMGIIRTFIFAITMRHSFNYLFGCQPVKGELGV